MYPLAGGLSEYSPDRKNGVRSTGFWGRVQTVQTFLQSDLSLEPRLCFPLPPEIGMDTFWSTFSSGTSELDSFS